MQDDAGRAEAKPSFIMPLAFANAGGYRSLLRKALLPIAFAAALVGNGNDLDGFWIGGETAIDDPVGLAGHFAPERSVASPYVGLWVQEDLRNGLLDPADKEGGILRRGLGDVGAAS
jgi:hypothetical protein